MLLNVNHRHGLRSGVEIQPGLMTRLSTLLTKVLSDLNKTIEPTQRPVVISKVHEKYKHQQRIDDTPLYVALKEEVEAILDPSSPKA